MRSGLRILPMKALAALCLLTGLSPLLLLLGRYCLPDAPALWYALPAISAAWALGACLAPGKRRAALALLGGALLCAWGAAVLLPGGWVCLAPLLPCLLILLLIPPAWSAQTWDEWPAAWWAIGVAMHFIGQFLSARPGFSGTGTPLSICFSLYALLLLTMLNRHGLRNGTHGAQKAPKGVARRNRLLVLALFIPALLAACWGVLGKWLEEGWQLLRGWIGRAVAWFLALFAREETMAPGAGGGGAGEAWGLPAGGEPSAFALLMEKVFYVVAVALLAAVLIWALVSLCKKLRPLVKKILARLRRYAQAAGEDYVDEAESTLNLDEKAQALRNKLQRVLSRPNIEKPWAELDGRARVRRLYRGYLRRRPESRARTAREALALEKRISREQASAFAELYERARYSDHPVSPQEADQLRREIK